MGAVGATGIRPWLRRHRALLAALLPALFLAAFLAHPFLSLLRVAAPTTDLGPWERARVLDSLQLGLLTSLLALLLGLPLAYLLGRHRFRGRRALRALVTVPFVMPVVVVAAGFLALLGPTGILARATGLDLGFRGAYWGLLLAHAFYNVPLVVRLVGDTWSHLDPRLEEAAATLGAWPWTRFARVTLPRLMPSVLAAALLAFLFGFTAFGTVLLLADPVDDATLEVAIWHVGVRLFDLPVAATLALIQLGVTLLAALAYTRLIERAGAHERPVDEASALQPLLRASLPLALVALLVALLLLLPLAAVLASALDTPEGVGFEAFARVFRGEGDAADAFYVSPARAVWNSLRFAAATVLLVLPLGLLAAISVTRARRGGLVDAAWMLPLGASSVTLGLGLLVAFPWRVGGWSLDLRTTALLLVLAHALVAFPFVVRALVGALRSADPALDEAARTLGAKAWQRAAWVHLPLLGPALALAAVLAASVSLGEFGATLVVLPPEHATVPVEMYRHLGASRPDPWLRAEGMALASVLLVLNLAAFLAVERLRPGRTGGF